jgi:hypothetical protein
LDIARGTLGFKVLSFRFRLRLFLTFSSLSLEGGEDGLGVLVAEREQRGAVREERRERVRSLAHRWANFFGNQGGGGKR